MECSNNKKEMKLFLFGPVFLAAAWENFFCHQLLVSFGSWPKPSLLFDSRRLKEEIQGVQEKYSGFKKLEIQFW